VEQISKSAQVVKRMSGDSQSFESRFTIPQFTSGSHIILGPGHRSHILSYLPGLTDYPGVEVITASESEGISKRPAEFMSLEPEAIIRYIDDHRDDEPHAIADVITLLTEEMDQIYNPVSSVRGLIEDTQLVQKLKENDPNNPSISDTESDIAEAKFTLRCTLTFVPKLMLAVNRLIQEDGFKRQVSEYRLSDFAHADRFDKGNRRTSQTNVQYFNNILAGLEQRITERVRQLVDVMQNPDFFHYLENEGLPTQEVNMHESEGDK
jgi:hypothetical protein